MAIASFIPTIWSARLLQHLLNALVARNFYNSDYEGEITDQGNTVRINQIGNISVFDYDRNKDMNAAEELSTVAQDLVIDMAKSFNFQVDNIDRVQMRADLMDAAMQRSAYALAEVEDTYLFNLLATSALPANKITDATITSANEMYELLVHMRTIMAKNNVPNAGRIIALPPEAVALLLKDDRFVGTGGSFAEGTLIAGLVGRAVGFDIYEVNTTPNNNTAIAGHALAATFASQIVQVVAYQPEKRFADALKGLSVYGAKVLVPEAIATAEITIDLAA
jgi:hypothetical protein